MYWSNETPESVFLGHVAIRLILVAILMKFPTHWSNVFVTSDQNASKIQEKAI